MSSAFSGVNGTVKSGATDMNVTGWSADPETDTFDSTTTGDGGWEDTTPSLQKFGGSFDFFYDLTRKPTGAVAGLTPGSTPTLTLQATTGEVFSGKALITKLSLKCKVKNGFEVTATFKSKGSWQYPT